MLSIESDKISDRLTVSHNCKISPGQFGVNNTAIEEDFQKFKSAIAETLSENMKLVDELPPLKTLSKDEIKEYLRKRIPTDLKKDKVFEKSVEIDKYVSNISRYLFAYYREIFDHHIKCKERMESDILDACRMYFNSNMPFEFLKTIEDSILVERDFLDIYDKRLRQEQIGLQANRNNRKKFEKLCSIHNRWVAPLNKLLEDIGYARRKLFMYVDFSNSKTIEDILKVKKIDASCVDMKIIHEFINCLQKLTKDAKMIVDKNSDFQPIKDYDETNGARSIREIMDLLSIVEG
jgi:hypothetical protein